MPTVIHCSTEMNAYTLIDLHNYYVQDISINFFQTEMTPYIHNFAYRNSNLQCPF